jgi:hypothetical protein
MMKKAMKTRRLNEDCGCILVYKYMCTYIYRYRLEAAVIYVQLCSVKQ